MKPQDRYFIGPSLRDKLREIVRVHDASAFGGGAARIPTAHQEIMRGGGEDSVRLGTIATTWNKGAVAEVTQIKGDGSAISPPVTFSAKNWFATVTISSGTKKVACAKVDGTWLLIAAEC